MKKYIFLATLLFVSLVFLSLSIATEKATQVTVEGQAVIFNKDKVTARDKAIDDALRKAVESSVGTMISAETKVQNYQVLSDKIYTQAKGYIKKYSVLTEKVEEGIITVKIQALVKKTFLEKDVMAIQGLIARKGKPRLLVMLAEQNVGQGGYSYWWGSGGSGDIRIAENTLIGFFRDKGFTFVDYQVLGAQKKIGKQTNVSNKDVMDLASKTEAEVVLIGKASARDAGSVMGTSMHSGQANISVRALNTDNGEIIATASSHGSSVHVDPTTAGTNALKVTTEKLSAKLMKKILAQWQKDTSGFANIRFKVSGLKNYKQLADLKMILQHQVRGVRGVHERRMSGKTAVLDLELSSTTQAFAAELSGKKIPKFSIEISKVLPNQVDIELK